MAEECNNMPFVSRPSNHDDWVMQYLTLRFVTALPDITNSKVRRGLGESEPGLATPGMS
jgi:hypothetical protein